MTRRCLLVPLRLLAAALAVTAGGCQGVETEPRSRTTVAEFDPAPVSPDPEHLVFPAVPQPSNLLMAPSPENPDLMQVNLPLQVELKVRGQDQPVVVDAFSTEAAEQLVESYLNTLHGFLTDGATSTSFKGLEVEAGALPGLINGQTVLVVDITPLVAPGVEGIPFRVEGPRLELGKCDAETGVTPLSILPPEGQEWIQGRTYAAVVTSLLQDGEGRPVRASYVFNLVKSRAALAKGGRSVCALPDELAVQLEELRLAMAPVLGWLESDEAGDLKMDRAAVALLWTFTIRPGSIAVNDPTKSQFPTPNDVVMTSAASTQHDCDGDGKADCLEGHLCFPVDCESDTPVQKAFFGYMNSLDGWPASMAGSLSFTLPLETASLTADSVFLYETGVAEPLDVSLGIDEAGTTVTIAPDAGFKAGAEYVGVATSGLLTQGGIYPVRPSTVTAVTKLTTPVFADGKSQLADFGVSDQDAELLEQLRLAIDAAIKAVGLDGSRPELAAVWSFTVQSHNEAIFDPTTGTIPYPNDVLMTLDDLGIPQKVNVPVDPSWPDDRKDIVEQMNLLDGFSTVAGTYTRFLRPLDEGSFKWLGAMTDVMGGKGLGDISLALADVTEVDVTQGTAGMMSLMQPENIYTAGEVKATFDGGRLVIRPTGGNPLPAGRRFMALAFDNLESKEKGTDGKPYPIEVAPVFFMARSPDPLMDEEGKSNLLTLSDADAAQLEQLRANYNSIFEALESPLVGVGREHVLMFWTFTTQTIGEWLLSLRSELKKLSVGNGATCPVEEAETAAYKLAHADRILLKGGTFTAYHGFQPTFATDPAPSDRMALKADGKPAFAEYKLYYILAIPKETDTVKAPFPLVILQHGLGGDKMQVLSQADTFLAAGYAVVAIDLPYHGQRLKEGVENGTGFFSGDAVATRDHLVQSALDIVQLVTFLTNPGNNGLSACLEDEIGLPALLDTKKLHFAGNSLGGMAGALALAIVGEIDSAALVVSGGHLTRILLETPDQDFKKPIDEALEEMGYKPGTQEYQQFLDTAQLLLDRGDPLNYARHLVRSPLAGNAKKKVFMLSAGKDGFMPKAASQELACAAREGVQPWSKEYAGMCHGFFFSKCGGGEGLDPAAAQAAKDVVAFFASDGNAAGVPGAKSGDALTCTDL